MSGNSTKGIFSSPSRGSLLGRVQSQTQNSPLSGIQTEVNQLVGNAVATISDEKTMASLFTAGLAGRFIRLGSIAASAKSLAPWALQGISHAPALAGESAVFAGMERKFTEWQGHAPTQAFQKDWARAALNLGSIKLFGSLARGQNLITQHLLIDTGMVAGHHVGHAFGLTEKPEGSLAQQVIQAEGMNLGMKGSLALLHGFSPRLSALEKSLDLSLESQEAGPSPMFGKLALLGPEGNIVRMNDQGGNGPRKPPPKPPRGGTPGRGAVPPVSPSLPPALSPSSSNPPSTVPRPGAQRRTSQLDAPRQAAPSFLPPAPTASIAAMSNAQLRPLCAIADNIPAPEHKILSLARIALEFSYAGRRANALEYFESAAALIGSLPEAGPARGRALSHLALEQAKAGDQKGAEANFQRAVEELERLQSVPNRSPADTMEAYGLVFTIAGDLMGAGREDTAKRLLDRATPTYQRVLGSQRSAHIGEEAVMKLVVQGQFEEALILAGKMDENHYPKTLFKLGRSAARQRRSREADEVGYLLGSRGGGELGREIFKALALNGEWDETNQRGLSVEDAADRTHMNILTARLLGQSEDPFHAGAIHDAQAAFLREHGGSLPPERRAQFFALLAGNCALWDHAKESYTTIHREHYPTLYDSARGELDPFLRKPRELDDGVTEAIAELVLSMQLARENQKLADEGKRTDALLKLLAPSTRSRVIGDVGVKLIEVGKAMTAFVWLDIHMKEHTDYSLYEKKLSLRELEMGNPEQALFLAQHISDLGLRFDAFWEIFTRHRGNPVPELLESTMPPPDKRKTERPPPLPGSKS